MTKINNIRKNLKHEITWLKITNQNPPKTQLNRWNWCLLRS